MGNWCRVVSRAVTIVPKQLSALGPSPAKSVRVLNWAKTPGHTLAQSMHPFGNYVELYIHIGFGSYSVLL